MSKTHKVVGHIATGFIALIVGMAVGSEGATDTPSAADALSTPKTVTKTVTPKSCRAALDDADVLTALEAKGLIYASRAFGAIQHFDADAIYRQAANMDALTPMVKRARAKYDRDAADCRGGDAT